MQYQETLHASTVRFILTRDSLNANLSLLRLSTVHKEQRIIIKCVDKKANNSVAVTSIKGQ
jgi:hypothetical protein